MGESKSTDREQRYVAMERRVRDELEPDLAQEALAALRKCPRRSGLPPMGSYFCECPVCTPDEWGLGTE